MGQVIKFPKDARSESEQAIREVISKMRPGQIPDNITNQVAKAVATAAEKWAFELQLTYTVSQDFGPEVTKEIQRIADLVARDATDKLKGKVIAERIFFELELAGVRLVPRQ